MLKWLRKYSRSWFIGLAIGAIVVVFIFWGVGGLRSPRFQAVAQVNGTPILLTAYLRQFQEVVKQFQERTQGEVTEETIKTMYLREQALNRLIDEALLLQAAGRLGIRVSPEELRERIRSYPFFQENGRFSERRYQQILSRNHLRPPEFEDLERRHLLLQKVQQEVTAFAKVSEGELKDLFTLSKEEVAVQYLVVSPEPYLARYQPGDEEVAAYYKDHAAAFRRPARAKVNYLLFRAQDFQEKVKPSPADVEEYLREHADEFFQPRVIRARQVFLALPPKATEAERQQRETQARELWSQAQSGEDFSQMARSHSQDEASREKGGDLGDVRRGQHPPQWDEVAFSLNPGEVGLAPTPQGFYLIKVEEIRETQKVPEAEARASERLKVEKGRHQAREAAEQARAEMPQASLGAVAKKLGMSPQETPLLTMRDAIPGLGVQPVFNQAALALKPQEISTVVDIPAGFAILQGVEQQPEHVPPLGQIKAEVRQAVQKERALAEAEKEAGRWLERLKKGETPARVAAEAGLTLKESGFFTRARGFPGPGRAEVLAGAAFRLSPEHPYPKKPLLWQDQYYLLAFKARRGPDPEDFQKEKDRMRAFTLEQKRQLLFAEWLNHERQRAKIKIYELP
jgi:peptidyl-prolyl cis-trans isomerase D